MSVVLTPQQPTVGVFEQRIAALEGGKMAVAASSGQSAQFMTMSVGKKSNALRQEIAKS